jgi:hypothetical protein
MPATVAQPSSYPSDFHVIYDSPAWREKFVAFLTHVYHLYPERKFDALIAACTAKHADDQSIYAAIQAGLPAIKPFLADLFYALPALSRQKREMAQQTMELLGTRRAINGYAEIGTTGRYISTLRKHIALTGPLWLIHDLAPTNLPVDIVERGQIKPLGRFVPLKDYAPIANDIADGSIDLLTCYIGLHHAPLDKLDAFTDSMRRILRRGGSLIVRDHDVTTPDMWAFVSLAHAVFNAGLNIGWDENARELRHFTAAKSLIDYLTSRGFTYSGKALRQEGDPSLNLLMEFRAS